MSIPKKLKTVLILLLSAFACAALCACDEAENTETVREVTPFTLMNEEKPGRKNIYLIVKNLTSSYWQVIIDAAGDAGIDFDCNVYYSGTTSELDWDIQSELIDIAVKQGADAIVFAPNDSVKLSAKVKEIYMSGIPIVLIDTVVNTEQYNLCYMTDNLMAGQQAAAEMLYQMKNCGISENETAKVAIQVGSTFSQTINERLAGFCQYWSQNAPENWTIIDEIKSNEGSIDNAVSCAEDFFSGYGDVRGVFGCNNGSTVGFARYMLNNQRKDVAIVGFDYSEEMASLINDSSYCSSTMLQRQYDMSYKGIRSALDILDGNVMDDCKYIDTGVIAVNNTNMNDPEVKEVIEQN